MVSSPLERERERERVLSSIDGRQYLIIIQNVFMIIFPFKMIGVGGEMMIPYVCVCFQDLVMYARFADRMKR